jgi:hypothetical protein
MKAIREKWNANKQEKVEEWTKKRGRKGGRGGKRRAGKWKLDGEKEKAKKLREKRRSWQKREEEKKENEWKRRLGKGQKFENMRGEGEVSGRGGEDGHEQSQGDNL